MCEMDDIVQEFLIESAEGLDRLDQDLVALEQDPTNQDLLAAIFRCLHAIKGSCDFLGFAKLESVTHAGENLLSKLRDGKLNLSQEITSALISLVEAVRTMLARIEQTRADGDEDYSQIIATMKSLLFPPDENQQEADSPQRITKRASPQRIHSTVSSGLCMPTPPAVATQIEPTRVHRRSVDGTPKTSPNSSKPSARFGRVDGPVASQRG